MYPRGGICGWGALAQSVNLSRCRHHRAFPSSPDRVRRGGGGGSLHALVAAATTPFPSLSDRLLPQPAGGWALRREVGAGVGVAEGGRSAGSGEEGKGKSNSAAAVGSGTLGDEAESVSDD